MNYSNELRAIISSRRKYLYRFGLNTRISELIGPPIGSSPIGSGHIYKLHYYGRCPECNNIIPHAHYNILLLLLLNRYTHRRDTHWVGTFPLLQDGVHTYILLLCTVAGLGGGGACKIKKE